MRSEVFTAAAIILCTIAVVRRVDNAPGTNAGSPQELASIQSVSSGRSPDRGAWSHTVRISSSRDHQFYINANVNQRSAHFLIDTGASYVALRDSDAREAGIYTAWTDYNYPVRTANGETKAALVTIDEIQIDGIRVEGVKAFILPDDQLSINLLGMSFLSRIESVEARANEMLLRG